MEFVGTRAGQQGANKAVLAAEQVQQYPRGVRIRRLNRPGDLGWVVMAHGEGYAEEFGWDTSFELDFARTAGYRRLTLWNNDVLVSARRIYEATGFDLVDEERHHSFGHDLVGQNWARDL